MELKKVHKQDRVRKPQEPYPTTERCRRPLWPPTQCTCIPSSLCCVSNKWTRDASALRWRPERGPASFRSGVGFLRLSNPVLSVYFSQLHPYSKWSFFRNFCPLVKLQGVCKCSIHYMTAILLLIFLSWSRATCTHTCTCKPQMVSSGFKHTSQLLTNMPLCAHVYFHT